MIAVTGIGIISPIGIGKEKALDSLRSSVSGISGADSSGLACPGVQSLGAVKDFMPRDFIPAMKARRMGRFSQLALASAVEAVADSGLTVGDGNRHLSGIAVGTGLAGTQSTDTFYGGLLKEGPEGTNPIVFPETVQNIAASHISMHFGITGPNITFSHADISSELALFFGCGLIEDQQAEAVIVTGADELSLSCITGYSALGLLSDRMSPYGGKRSGFVLAEGAATVVLERLDTARARNARIYCIIDRPFICSSPVRPEDYDLTGNSMVSAMSGALHKAGIELPGMISASANSTRGLDMSEAEAISKVFGARAVSVPVNALRSFYGYFQSDGLLRTALSALCMSEGIIPRTLGLSMSSDGLGLMLCKDAPLKAQMESVLINSFSAGGSAASLIIRRPG